MQGTKATVAKEHDFHKGINATKGTMLCDLTEMLQLEFYWCSRHNLMLNLTSLVFT